MSTLALSSVDFNVLARQILAGGHCVRFTANGSSMFPFIQDGDVLEVSSLAGKRLRRGDVLLVECGGERLLVHRLVKIRPYHGSSYYLIKGDSSTSPDGWVQSPSILGRVDKVEHEGNSISLASPAQRWRAWLWVAINPWVGRLSWLPAAFRRLVKKRLLGV